MERARVNRVDVSSLTRGMDLMGGRFRTRSPPPRPPRDPPALQQNVGTPVADQVEGIREACDYFEKKLSASPLKIPVHVFSLLRVLKEIPEDKWRMGQAMHNLYEKLIIQQLKSFSDFNDGIERLLAKLDK